MEVRAMQLQGAVRLVTRVLSSTRRSDLADEVVRHLDPIIGSMLRQEEEDAALRRERARRRRMERA